MERIDSHFIKNLTENIILITEDDRIIYFNDAALLSADKLGINDLKGKDVNIFLQKLTKTDKIEFQKAKNVYYSLNDCGKDSYNLIIKLPLNDNKFFVSFHYVTEASKKLVQTDKLKRFYENVLDKAFDGIVIVNKEGKITYLNKAAVRILGLPKEKLLNRIVTTIFRDPKAIGKFNALMSEFQKKGYVPEYFKNFSKSFITPYGEIFIDIAITSFQDMNGDWNAIGIIRDFTEKYKSDEKLKQQKKSIEEKNEYLKNFISVVAHDIKNVISQTMSLTELILEDFESYEKKELKTFINMIHSTTEKGYKLLENLLQWGKAITDNMPFIPVNIKLQKLIDKVIEYLASQAKQKNLTIDANIADLEINADYNTIFIALYNILNNAIKFSYENKKIEINALHDDNKALITIKDYGRGMKKEILENLFTTPFKYLQTGTKGETGSGLGMLLVYEFIKKNKGEISVESTVNQGTTFHIKLPLFNNQ